MSSKEDTQKAQLAMMLVDITRKIIKYTDHADLPALAQCNKSFLYWDFRNGPFH